MNRWNEFLEDDATGLKSINRLATFIAVVTLTLGFFGLLIMCVAATGSNLREYLGALTTVAIILAGLGGFNYAAGRAAGAYTQVRVAQAERGLQPTPAPPLLNPTTIINTGAQSPSLAAKDVAIKADGDVNIRPSTKKRRR